MQVTTHSRLLVSENDLERLADYLNLQSKCLKTIFLQSFQTQQQCRDEVR